jgi:hypothetical protein
MTQLTLLSTLTSLVYCCCCTRSNDKFSLETKPHGHGDVHHLMHKSGIAKTLQVSLMLYVYEYNFVQVSVNTAHDVSSARLSLTSLL